MIVKSENLRCGDILIDSQGEAEVCEVFELPSGGAGRVSNMIKVTVRGKPQRPDRMGIFSRSKKWTVRRPREGEHT